MKRIWIIVLVLIIVLALSVFFKQFILPDEGTSILSASCNQVVFKQTQQNTWIDAQMIKNLMKPDSVCFHTIARDLQLTDRHPPLYFWLLHVSYWIFGDINIAIIILNAGLLLLSTILLFIISRMIFNGTLYPTIITCLFLLSPGTFVTTIIGRQYLLLTFLALLFTYSAMAKSPVLFFFSFLGGLLTNYLFLVFSLPIVAYYLYRESTRKFILGCIIVSIIVFLLIMPSFFTQILRITNDMSSEPFVDRVSASIKSFKTLILPGFIEYAYNIWALPVYVLAILSLMALFFFLTHFDHFDFRVFTNTHARRIFTLALIGSALPILLVLLFLMPTNKMNPRYRNFFTPFIFIVPFLLHIRKKKILGILLITIAVLSLALTLISYHYINKDIQAQHRTLGSYDYAIIDTESRGHTTALTHNILNNQVVCWSRDLVCTDPRGIGPKEGDSIAVIHLINISNLHTGNLEQLGRIYNLEVFSCRTDLIPTCYPLSRIS